VNCSEKLTTRHHGFHLMAKPCGPTCNLRCSYCFYCEKEQFFPKGRPFRMSDQVLESYINQYIAAQPGSEVVFDWQGGEPTLAGIDFFQQALDLQKKYAQGKQISNTLQTNGTKIDEAWCRFLTRNSFLVGLSMDGPEEIHNACRLDAAGNPTFSSVLSALKLMQEHGVEFNILATVNRLNARHPLEVYRFFRQHDVHYLQFIPIVEQADEQTATVTDYSVESKQYGAFLTQIYQEWIQHDVGKMFVMNFEWALAAWADTGSGVCYLAPHCGRNLILEHNGDIFSCDHFMYPAYRLGNLQDEGGLQQIIHSGRQDNFGAAKETSLPECCRLCDFLFACHGGCPKHRFNRTPDGKPGLNYLCEGIKSFYQQAKPSMQQMLELIHKGVPVYTIMELNGSQLTSLH